MATSSGTLLAGTEAGTARTKADVPSNDIGVRSLSESNGNLYRSGLMACVSKAISNVYPSGADRATCAAPIEPPAPALFTTTNGCFNALLNWRAMVLVTTSTMPPGGNGTTSSIGFSGYAAVAGVAVKASMMQVSAVAKNRVLARPTFAFAMCLYLWKGIVKTIVSVVVMKRGIIAITEWQRSGTSRQRRP